MLNECSNPDCSLQFHTTFLKCPSCQTPFAAVDATLPEQSLKEPSSSEPTRAPDNVGQSAFITFPFIAGAFGGLALIIPVAIAYVAGFVVSKSVPSAAKRPALVYAFALQAVDWFSLVGASLYFRIFIPMQIAQIVMLALALLWFVIRPNLIIIGLLVIYQLTCIANTLVALQSFQLEDQVKKAVVISLLFRVSAVYFMLSKRVAFSTQPRAI